MSFQSNKMSIEIIVIIIILFVWQRSRSPFFKPFKFILDSLACFCSFLINDQISFIFIFVTKAIRATTKLCLCYILYVFFLFMFLFYILSVSSQHFQRIIFYSNFFLLFLFGHSMNFNLKFYHLLKYVILWMLDKKNTESCLPWYLEP